MLREHNPILQVIRIFWVFLLINVLELLEAT